MMEKEKILILLLNIIQWVLIQWVEDLKGKSSVQKEEEIIFREKFDKFKSILIINNFKILKFWKRYNNKKKREN